MCLRLWNAYQRKSGKLKLPLITEVQYIELHDDGTVMVKLISMQAKQVEKSKITLFSAFHF